MHRIVAAAIAVTAALTAASTAYAQQRPCAPTALMIERLAKTFGEHLAAAGLSAGGKIVSFYANAEKQTFTILMSTPDGISCVVDSGEAFAIEAAPAVPKGGES